MQFLQRSECSFQALKPGGLRPLSLFVWLPSFVSWFSIAISTADESAAKAWESVPHILNRLVPNGKFPGGPCVFDTGDACVVSKSGHARDIKVSRMKHEVVILDMDKTAES